MSTVEGQALVIARAVRLMHMCRSEACGIPMLAGKALSWGAAGAMNPTVLVGVNCMGYVRAHTRYVHSGQWDFDSGSL